MIKERFLYSNFLLLPTTFQDPPRPSGVRPKTQRESDKNMNRKPLTTVLLSRWALAPLVSRMTRPFAAGLTRTIPCVALALICLAGIEAGGAEKPNVLLIVSDDQRPDTIAALGNEFDRDSGTRSIGSRGTVFTRATCANPICTPSRAELLTGCTGIRNGVFDFGRTIALRYRRCPNRSRPPATRPGTSANGTTTAGLRCTVTREPIGCSRAAVANGGRRKWITVDIR